MLLTEIEFLWSEFDGLVDKVTSRLPSQLAEECRYLPPSVTANPGYFDYSLTPYWREVVDCLAVTSPIREIYNMKGVQVGYTTGVLENGLLYVAAEVSSAPCMLLTSTGDLAKQRLEGNIIPMFKDSGMADILVSSDESNKRKTGKTKDRIEWKGGGFALPYGAQSAHKLRSTPIRFLFMDESDAYPAKVGNDGDPVTLAEARTKTYEETRKILAGSTPLIEGQSNIHKAFKKGDQRYWYVPCKSCGGMQVLEFNKKDKETGKVHGLVFDVNEKGVLIRDSVRYECKYCGHPHKNDDKAWMLPRGEWRPTAKPIRPDVRSYHLSELYSPAGASSWESVVDAWFEAWDVVNNRVKSVTKLQVFYNNELGIPFKKDQDRLKMRTVSGHRRPWYQYGQIKNMLIREYCGAPILVVVGTVDVQKDDLSVAIWGYTKNFRKFLLDYWVLKGDTSDIDDPHTWGTLRHLITNTMYESDQGDMYRPTAFGVDSGHQTDIVYKFCAEYPQGVIPLKGTKRGEGTKEFATRNTSINTKRLDICVDYYKDNQYEALKRYWDPQHGEQPSSHFNAPSNCTDAQIGELTKEYPVEGLDPKTNQIIQNKWHRTKGARNELWDLLIYANAMIDLVALEYTQRGVIKKDDKVEVDFHQFWREIEANKYFYI